MRESALRPSLLARGRLRPDAIYAWHLARLGRDGLSLRAQDLFEPKTSIAAGARYMRRLWRIYHAQNLFEHKTSSSTRPLRAQDLFEPKTARPPSALPSLGLQRGCGKRVIRFRKRSAMHRAQPSLGRRSALLPGKSPANTLSALSAGAPALVAGNTPFPLSWSQGDLFPCGEWGSAPQTLGENKGRGMGQRPTISWRKQEVADGRARLDGIAPYESEGI